VVAETGDVAGSCFRAEIVIRPVALGMFEKQLDIETESGGEGMPFLGTCSAKFTSQKLLLCRPTSVECFRLHR
jgi:hypothetical protein